MRILIVSTHVPFTYGGAEYHSSSLMKNLMRHGHTVDEVKIPFKWYPPEKILDHILSVRLLDLTESSGNQVDLIVGLKFPAYFVKHHNKVLWILHQYKQAYELWSTEYGDLTGKRGAAVRNSIIQADNSYIPEAKKVFTNSKNVSNRLKKFNNIDSKPLYHPPPNHETLYSGRCENYIFYPSRLNAIKRQHLAIEAMRLVNKGVKLVIAGFPENEAYDRILRDHIKKYDLHHSVEIRGAVTEEEKAELYANALAVLFIPFDEDYGYVTLEAFYSKKAVITCNDSGGPLEFVQDNNTGLICKPEPGAIAEAINTLAGNREKSVRYGKEGYSLVQELNLSWDNVIEALTS